MAWWQNIITLFVGALIGFFVNRLGAKSERDAIERRHLQDAVQGLLIEMQANIELTEKPPEPALLPRLAKDMWNMHKSSVAELPFVIQEGLYRAYVDIDKVNAVVETRIAFSNRKGDTPGTWDTRYENETNKAREAMKKARDILFKYLEDIETITTKDSLVNKLPRPVMKESRGGSMANIEKSSSTKSRSISVLIGIMLGLIVVSLSYLFRNSERGTSLVAWIGDISILMFVFFILYFVAAQILSIRNKKEPPIKGISTAFIIYFGLLSWAVSFQPALVTELSKNWDIRFAAFGLAMIALGIGFFGRDRPSIP